MIYIGGVEPAEEGASSNCVSRACFFGTTVLSSVSLVLLSTSTYFLHSVSVALTKTLLAGLSLLGFFVARTEGPY